MRCLVTGGCGFIGTHLVRRLIEDGWEVTMYDNLLPLRAWDEELCGGCKPVHGSVTNPSLLDRVCRDQDVIFHLAAIQRVQESVDDPITTHAVNVTGTLNVLQAAAEANVSRVVYASSSSVYGIQDGHMMHEGVTPSPRSPYALQKLMGEQYAAMYAALYGLTTVSLRYFNVYGPGCPARGSYPLVIPKFLKQRAEGRPLTVYGNGKQTRSYTHVRDVVDATVLAATAELEQRSHTVLNVGTKQETSVNEIAALIGGPVEYVISNPGEGFEEGRKAADWERAYAMLGWAPKVGIFQGLKELVKEMETARLAESAA